MKRIQLISGPRNISTALMYCFGNRSDCIVIDEPFYGHYLINDPIVHPGKNEIINDMETKMDLILEKQIFAYHPKEILFIKNMAHHYKYVSYSVLDPLKNVFLIRDLKKLIASFAKVIPNPSLQDIGIKIEFDLYQYLKNQGKEPIVLDADELLKNPKLVLNQLCQKLGIDFSNQMLTWNPGPRKEDGIWAKHWYHNVHKSTGFKKQTSEPIELKNNLLSLYKEALPYYKHLFSSAIKAQ